MFQDNYKSDDLRETAFHEAGHTFIHELFDFPYKDVLINEDGGELNFTYQEITEADSMLSKLIYSFICFSGSIAEDMYKYPRGSDDSQDSIYGSSLYFGGGITDLYKYQEMGLSRSYMESLLDFTRKIIIDNWLIISMIANSLVENKYLTDKEVKKLLSNCELKEKYHVYILELQSVFLKLHDVNIIDTNTHK